MNPQGETLEMQERRLRINAEAQVIYMTTEIASILGLPVQSPAATVGSVRDLMFIAESLKEEKLGHLGDPGPAGENLLSIGPAGADILHLAAQLGRALKGRPPNE